MLNENALGKPTWISNIEAGQCEQETGFELLNKIYPFYRIECRFLRKGLMWLCLGVSMIAPTINFQTLWCLCTLDLAIPLHKNYNNQVSRQQRALAQRNQEGSDTRSGICKISLICECIAALHNLLISLINSMFLSNYTNVADWRTFVDSNAITFNGNYAIKFTEMAMSTRVIGFLIQINGQLI